MTKARPSRVHWNVRGSVIRKVPVLSSICQPVEVLVLGSWQVDRIRHMALPPGVSAPAVEEGEAGGAGL